MYSTIKDNFLKKIEAKYSLGVQQQNGFNIITEADIFGAIKDIKGVMMVPGSYFVEFPPTGTESPWGPTITFQYKDISQQSNFELIEQVKSQIKSKLGPFIHSIGITYLDGIYNVIITEKL